MSEVRIRPMRPDDVAAAERLSAVAYDDDRSPARADVWRRRTSHLLGTDPGGCWVAEVDDDQVGFVVSLRRELMWLLASYAVRPGLQGQGVGTALLAVAERYGQGCLRAMFNSSLDQRAVRRYRASGFHLHPQLTLSGTVERSALPVVDHVREGSLGDRDLMDSVDRRTRGAAHGPDHAVLLAAFRLVVTDRPDGSGYAYVDDTGAPVLLAATDRRTAARLMWEALASVAPGCPGLRRARERRERVGAGRRAGRAARGAPVGLPRGAAPAAAVAVPAARVADVRLSSGCGRPR